MLEQFKRFADWVNSKRRGRAFDFERLVITAAQHKNVHKILEVGSNVRPILSKGPGYELHGLDPDPTIDLEKARAIFDRFHNHTIEDFQTDEKYDIIVINMVLEHLENNDIVFEKFRAVLNKGGMVLLHIPNNLHPFSIINRLVSHNLKIKILKVLRPWAEVGVITGWKSYYDHCNIWGMKKLAKRHGLKVTKTYTDYNASDYFAFFPPLFLLVVLYEELVRLFGIRLLCAYLAMEVVKVSD